MLGVILHELKVLETIIKLHFIFVVNQFRGSYDMAGVFFPHEIGSFDISSFDRVGVIWPE